MDERITRLEELLKDETTQTEIFSGSIEEVQKKLAGRGLTFSIEELQSLAKGLSEAGNNNEELNELELENVAGGASYEQDCYNWGKKIGSAFKSAVAWAIGLFV